VLANGLTGPALQSATKWTFIVAGVASLLLAAFSLTLPHTPPKKAGKEGAESLAWLEAVKLLKHPFVLVLWLVTFVDSFVHNCYFNWTGSFLGAEAVDAALREPRRATAHLRAYERRIRNALGTVTRWFGTGTDIAEMKRLELAKCLALRPDLIILDELFSGLSLAEVAGILPIIEKMKTEGKTILMVEHRLRELFRIADRVIVLNFGQKIADGRPEVVGLCRQGGGKGMPGGDPEAVAVEVDEHRLMRVGAPAVGEFGAVDDHRAELRTDRGRPGPSSSPEGHVPWPPQSLRPHRRHRR
jgi:hypothetical protein